MSKDKDPWKELAENRDTLKMIIEEEMPFAPYAENLLDELDERDLSATNG